MEIQIYTNLCGGKMYTHTDIYADVKCRNNGCVIHRSVYLYIKKIYIYIHIK